MEIAIYNLNKIFRDYGKDGDVNAKKQIVTNIFFILFQEDKDYYLDKITPISCLLSKDGLTTYNYDINYFNIMDFYDVEYYFMMKNDVNIRYEEDNSVLDEYKYYYNVVLFLQKLDGNEIFGVVKNVLFDGDIEKTAQYFVDLKKSFIKDDDDESDDESVYDEEAYMHLYGRKLFDYEKRHGVI